MLDFLSTEFFAIVVGVAATAWLVYAAVTKFSTLSALTQMGAVNERSASWSDWSKRKPAAGTKAATKDGEAEQPPPDSKAKPPPVTPGTVLKSDETADDRSDKLTFTLSTVNLMLTAYIAGAFPTYFYLWHTPKCIGYIAHRWWTFRKEKSHYLLFDFCYWANLLVLLYVWVPAIRQSTVAFQICYILAHSSLAWAVLAFGQSLIFHSLAHMTSVHIHVSPMILMYCIRWYSDGKEYAICDDFPKCASVSAFDLVYNAFFKFYMFWLVAYYVVIYYILDEHIRTRGYKTLFNRIITRGPTRHIAKLTDSEIVQKTVYMCTHAGFSVFTMVVASFLWRSQVANFVFMFGVLTVAASNGSNFYFTVFLEQVKQNEASPAVVLQDPSQNKKLADKKK